MRELLYCGGGRRGITNGGGGGGHSEGASHRVGISLVSVLEFV